jgi:two-component system, NtrC family, response regulator AtoC
LSASDPERDRGDTAPLPRRNTPARVSAEPVFSLLVYSRHGAQVVELRPGAPIIVGRDHPADVVVPDRSLSRCHARFVLERGNLSIEDLGSTNGTRLRGELVKGGVLKPGDTVELGSVVVSPHMRAAVEPAIAGLSGHDAFVAALDVELARARHFGDSLALLLLQPVGAAAAQAHVSHWWRPIGATLQAVEEAALYGPCTVEVLLPRIDAAAAVARANALVALAPRGRILVCGLATFPATGTTADELLEAARHAVSTASAAQPVVVAGSADTTTTRAAADLPVGASAATRAIFAEVDRMASARLPVLLFGETGSGKEVVARAIHQRSPRAGRAMVSVNCGALPAALVESTLFGHEKGAFSGAIASALGAFRAADGGTVLLDEIGELAAPAQVALLRVLEEGRVRPVGASRDVTVDVRVIAATHRDLDALCERGTFRRDLYYRLAGFTLTLPPLRERRDDIEPLARSFLAQISAVGRAMPELEPAALAALLRYDWPGNVRELRNAVERAATIAHGDRITVDDLPERVRKAVASRPTPPLADDLLEGTGDLRERVQRYEAQLIAAALRRTNGNQTEAAELLGVPVRTLNDKIHRLGIDPPKTSDE